MVYASTSILTALAVHFRRSWGIQRETCAGTSFAGPKRNTKDNPFYHEATPYADNIQLSVRRQSSPRVCAANGECSFILDTNPLSLVYLGVARR